MNKKQLWLLVILLFAGVTLYAQVPKAINYQAVAYEALSLPQDEYDRSIKELEKINNAFLDAASSFLKYPYDHDNTMIVFDQLKRLNATYKKIQSDRYNNISKLDNYKVRYFYDMTDRMQAFAAVFEELLREITGYNSSGIEGAEMETLLEPIFNEFGWEKRMLNLTCSDAYFVEYSYKDFKMMFIKSTRPKNDYRNNIYYNIAVTFTYEGINGEEWECYVGGNKYRMIQFKDDKNVRYQKVIKAKSVRK